MNPVDFIEAVENLRAHLRAVERQRLAREEMQARLSEMRSWCDDSIKGHAVVTANASATGFFRNRTVLVVEDSIWEKEDFIQHVLLRAYQDLTKKHSFQAYSPATYFRNATSQASWGFPVRGLGLTPSRKPTMTPQRI